MTPAEHAENLMKMSMTELMAWGAEGIDNPFKRLTFLNELQRRGVEAQIHASHAATMAAWWQLVAVVATVVVGLGGWLIALFLRP